MKISWLSRSTPGRDVEPVTNKQYEFFIFFI